jgi:succinate dehydrogenase/fumarate reductase flavoprotein subunit
LDYLFCDLLIIGSGAAGLRTAIAAGKYSLDVLVISKASPGKGTCTIISGGVFAGTKQEEKPDSHINRTLQAGRGLNQKELVDILAHEGPRRLNELLAWGFRGVYHRGYLFSEGRAPLRGQPIINCLEQKAKTEGTRFLGGLLVAGMKIQPQATGVLAYSVDNDSWLSIRARAVILATGGAAGLFQRHDNPKRILGDGYCLALQAGAVLQDMEFVQFYPLGLAEPGLPPFLIPPRIADCGRIYNNSQEDIYSKYGITERPAGERARDRLSQALFTETYRNRNEVWLDLKGVSDADWNADPFSASAQNIFGERYGAKHRPVRIAPLAHHVMGGVRIDANGQTSVPGLFAAGEVTGGLHGANRMGGNALTETVVFGARAGDAASKWILENTDEVIAERSIGFEEPFSQPVKAGRKPDLQPLRSNLQKTLWENGGILRNQAGLTQAISEIRAIRDEANELPLTGNPRQVQQILELQFAACTAELMLQGALQREESRGAHYREDFPEQDDINWRGHFQIRQLPDSKLRWAFDPIQTGVINT